MTLRLVLALLLATASAPAAAGGLPSAARRQLAELKKLCDAGLVAPPVCLEQQRAILGLAAGLDAGTAASPPRAFGGPDPESAETTSSADDGPATQPAASGAAITHDSVFGFRIALPAGWSVLSGEMLDGGFEALRAGLAAHPAAVALVDRLRQQGAHRRGEVYAVAGDRLQVLPSPAPLPEDPAVRARICTQFGSATSRVAGRRLSTQLCSPRTVGGRPALLIERDALLPGARTVQYWISTPDGAALSFVTTCRAEDADRRRRELEGVVESLQWL